MSQPVFDSSTAKVPQSHRQTLYVPPVGSTTFVLVRHGASEPYTEGKSFPLKHGHGDPHLDVDGHSQALKLVPRLVREQIDAVYVTPLTRTHQTIAPYLAATGRSAAEVFDLREVFLGDWEGGQFRSRVAANDPAWLLSTAEGEWGRIPNGETSAQLLERCANALMELHRIHVDQRVICVAHGGVIGALCRWATGAPQTYHWGPDNASVSVLIVHGDQRRLHLYNDIAHLAA